MEKFFYNFIHSCYLNLKCSITHKLSYSIMSSERNKQRFNVNVGSSVGEGPSGSVSKDHVRRTGRRTWLSETNITSVRSGHAEPYIFREIRGEFPEQFPR